MVADVPPAGDHGTAIGNQQLVVHAGVESLEPGHHLGGPAKRAPPIPRVEHPEVDVRVSLKLEEELIQSDRHQIVNDQADLDSPVGCPDRPIQHQASGMVRVPEIGLEIEGADG